MPPYRARHLQNDAVLPAQLGHGHPAFSLPQDHKDLRFLVSRHLHLNLLMQLAEKILLPQPLTLGGIPMARAALPATGAALAYFGLAGERASQGANGPGSFQVAFLDALYTLSPQDVTADTRVSLA